MAKELLCAVADLQEAVTKIVRRGEHLIGIVKIADDLYAFEALCPHWKGPLARGPISIARREIVCPWHRFRYSLADGQCVAAEGRRPRLRTYPVLLEDGKIFAELDREAAEAA